MTGPLTGLRVIEFAGQGPAPFAGMMLADQGADVVRVDRVPADDATGPGRPDVLGRGRRSIALDLKAEPAREVALRMVERADVLLEGFRPGVMERLGLGPDVCLRRRPSLVYGRMTGWGQDGPLAQAPGHDLNYIALTGALHAIGPAGGPPVPPLNLVGDFGGGGMLLAFGVLCAVHEAVGSGQGQVVDAAMVDGTAALMATFYPMARTGAWSEERGTNILDGGAHFYGVYETADGGHVTFAAIEPAFYRAFLDALGLDDAELPAQYDRTAWAWLRERVAAVVRGRTREEWTKLLEGSDACFAPVLSPTEALGHPHHAARETFLDVGGVPQPTPAPRFGRTPAGPPSPAPRPGADTGAVLAELGYSVTEREALRRSGAAG